MSSSSPSPRVFSPVLHAEGSSPFVRLLDVRDLCGRTEGVDSSDARALAEALAQALRPVARLSAAQLRQVVFVLEYAFRRGGAAKEPVDIDRVELTAFSMGRRVYLQLLGVAPASVRGASTRLFWAQTHGLSIGRKGGLLGISPEGRRLRGNDALHNVDSFGRSMRARRPRSGSPKAKLLVSVDSSSPCTSTSSD